MRYQRQSKWSTLKIYVVPQIGTGPVLELDPTFHPVLELGCFYPQYGTVWLGLGLDLVLGLGNFFRLVSVRELGAPLPNKQGSTLGTKASSSRTV